MWEVAMSARIGLAVISLSLLWSTRGWSADLRVMSGGAPQEVLAALTPEFENRTGHKATFSFAVITTLEQRLASGERTNVVLMPVPVIDKLVHAGRAGANSWAASQALEAHPEAVLDLIEMLFTEGRKTRPNEKLVSAYVYMIGHALEFIRMAAENGQASAQELADAVRL